MADTNYPIHTQVHIVLFPGHEPAVVSIFASTAAELKQIVAELAGEMAGHEQPQAQAQPTPQAQPGPTSAAQPQPQAQPAPTATQTAPPAPSAAESAPQASATPSADATPVTVNDVLPDARALLSSQGEEALRKIVSDHGQTSISTADAAQLPSIWAAIRQALGK